MAQFNDRKQIKENAKRFIKGNMLMLFLTTIILVVIDFALTEISSGIYNNIAGVSLAQLSRAEALQLSLISMGISFVVGALTFMLNVGLMKVYLDFVRTKEVHVGEIFFLFNKYNRKYHIATIIAGILHIVFVILGFVALIIPGIIILVGLALLPIIIADNPDRKAMESIKETWKLTKGYKSELFVLYIDTSL